MAFTGCGGAAPRAPGRASVSPLDGFGGSKRDDTAALQAALDRGGLIRLPRRTLRIRQTLTARRPVHLQGAGIGRTVIVDQRSQAGQTVVVDGPSVTFEGFTIDARSTPASSGSYALFIAGEDFTGRALHVEGNSGTIAHSAHRCTWERCTSGIWIYQSHDSRVLQCDIAADTDASLALISNGSHRAIVEENRFTGGRGNDAARGIAVRDSDHCRLRFNQLNETHWYGIEVLDSQTPWIEGNWISRPGALRSDYGPTVTGVRLGQVNGGAVLANQIEDCGGYGIALVSCLATGKPLMIAGNRIAWTEDPGITVQGSKHVRLERNEVHAATWGFTIGEAAPSSEVAVIGNSFDSCPWGGGYVRGSTSCQVIGNSFVDCGDDPWIHPSTDAVIVLMDGDNGRPTKACTVRGNRAKRSAAPFARGVARQSPHQVVAAHGAPGYPGHTTSGNDISDNSFE